MVRLHFLRTEKIITTIFLTADSKTENNRDIIFEQLVLEHKIIPTLFLTASARAENNQDVIFASWRFVSEEVKIVLSF